MKKNTVLLENNIPYADLFELRADFLQDSELTWEKLFEWKIRQQEEKHGHSSRPCIFTLRETQDGGNWSSNNLLTKQALITNILEQSLFEYVDIELYNNNDQENEKYIHAAMHTIKKHTSSSRLILSQHIFSSNNKNPKTHHATFHNEDMVSLLRTYSQKYNASNSREHEKAIIKYAIHCNNSADFYQFLLAAQTLQNDDQDYILIPIGTFGQSARILSYLSASLWTYCTPDIQNDSSSKSLQNLGQISAQQLDTLYRYHTLNLNKNKQVPVFAVIGDPILHSKSPLYFNTIFKEHHVDAVYIHLHMNDLSHITEIIKLMNIQGLSVTIPHKHAIINYLEANKIVKACSACNTVLCTPNKWLGYNTDVFGFLSPLLKTLNISYPTATHAIEQYHHLLKKKPCLVIGAGGAAHAVIYALLLCGADVLITNRSIERAKTMSNTFSAYDIPYCALDDYTTMEKWQADIIVQTTSVGMIENKSPLPHYPFKGKETVYDIIYNPPETLFLSQAKMCGCSIINGSEMFINQAKEQATLFLQSI